MEQKKPAIIDYASPRPEERQRADREAVRQILPPGPLFGVLLFILFGMLLLIALVLVLAKR